MFESQKQHCYKTKYQTLIMIHNYSLKSIATCIETFVTFSNKFNINLNESIIIGSLTFHRHVDWSLEPGSFAYHFLALKKTYYLQLRPLGLHPSWLYLTNKKITSPDMFQIFHTHHIPLLWQLLVSSDTWCNAKVEHRILFRNKLQTWWKNIQ